MLPSLPASRVNPEEHLRHDQGGVNAAQLCTSNWELRRAATVPSFTLGEDSL